MTERDDGESRVHLTRNTSMPGICMGAFLGLYWEPFISYVNHVPAGASSEQLQTGSQERVSQNRTTNYRGRRWTEAGEETETVTGFYFKTFDTSETEKVVCLLARIFSLRGKASLHCILCYFSSTKTLVVVCHGSMNLKQEPSAGAPP